MRLNPPRRRLNRSPFNGARYAQTTSSWKSSIVASAIPISIKRATIGVSLSKSVSRFRGRAAPRHCRTGRSVDTASPSLGRLTSLPTSMTRPTISWPGTITPVPRPLDETGCRDRRRKAGGCYEELAKRFEADGWIVGRVTMEHVVDGVARTPKAVAGDLREIHVADRKGRNVAVAIDPQGKYSCTGG